MAGDCSISYDQYSIEYHHSKNFCRYLTHKPGIVSPPFQLSHFVTAILSSLVTERISNSTPQQQQQQQQPRRPPPSDSLPLELISDAASLLRTVLARWATPVNLLQSQTLKALTTYLSDATISVTSQLGVLVAMTALGPRALKACLLPQLGAYLQRANDGLLRGALLIAGRVLLGHFSQLEKYNYSEAMAEAYALLYEAFGDGVTPIPLGRLVGAARYGLEAPSDRPHTRIKWKVYRQGVGRGDRASLVAKVRDKLEYNNVVIHSCCNW